MSRPLLNQGSATTPGAAFSAVPSTTTQKALLGGVRSPRYLEALRKLDASVTLTAVEVDALIEEIHREFTEKWAPAPEGFVSRCYLGAPYEAHVLDVAGRIVEHYEAGRPLPGALERARSLTRTDTYLTIEVYADRLVCVRPDGSTVTLEG